MKIEDAIEHVILAKGRFLDLPERYEALHMAKEALEKQTPKEVKTDMDDRYICPNCNSGVYCDCGKRIKYCLDCGQALRWD